MRSLQKRAIGRATRKTLATGPGPNESTTPSSQLDSDLLCKLSIFLLGLPDNAEIRHRTFASSVYTPGVPEVAKQFHVSTTVALLPFSLFVLGLGFGPILGAPLSEKRGRSGTYLISMPLFALFTLGAGFSQNFASLVICRWFAGIFASPPLTIGAGTIADIWEPGPRAAMSTLYVLCPYLGPAMG